jgi:hypothetical protein
MGVSRIDRVADGWHLPEGDFLLPLCLNRQEFGVLVSALHYASLQRPTMHDIDALSIVLRALPNVQASCDPCADDCDRGECRDWRPTDAFIDYQPNHPVTTPDLVPVGYLLPPFSIVGDEVNWINEVGNLVGINELAGVKRGDVVILPTSLPIGSFLAWSALQTIQNYLDFIQGVDGAGWPRVRINLAGPVRVQVEFVNLAPALIPLPVPTPIGAGGVFICVQDGSINPLSWRTVDTFKDVTAAVPETSSTQWQEFEFIGEGPHTLDIYRRQYQFF